MTVKILRLILRLIVGGVFVYAGVAKIIDPVGFLVDVKNYQILSDRLAWLVAIYLPWLEVACGVALITNVFVNGALAICGALMLLFIAALVGAWLGGLDIDCGCFSASSLSSGRARYMWWLARDLILLCIIFEIFLLRRGNSSVPAC
jgi:uncharacterized membrane protein YphA (DoxX/SURF4 family)